MPRTVFILNGPNLNLLGVREPQIYGTETLDMIKQRCIERAKTHNFVVDFRQSNFEGDLVQSVHEARDKAVAVIINPAGLTFTSVSLLDSLKAFDGVKFEVHLTNFHRRESYYEKSLISYTADAVIAGLGGDGYVLALDALALKLAAKSHPQ